MKVMYEMHRDLKLRSLPCTVYHEQFLSYYLQFCIKLDRHVSFCAGEPTPISGQHYFSPWQLGLKRVHYAKLEARNKELFSYFRGQIACLSPDLWTPPHRCDACTALSKQFHGIWSKNPTNATVGKSKQQSKF